MPQNWKLSENVAKDSVWIKLPQQAFGVVCLPDTQCQVAALSLQAPGSPSALTDARGSQGALEDASPVMSKCKLTPRCVCTIRLLLPHPKINGLLLRNKHVLPRTT